MSDLSPQCAPKRTSTKHCPWIWTYEYILTKRTSGPLGVAMQGDSLFKSDDYCHRSGLFGTNTMRAKKSDSSIVPAKLANKAERSAAVEGDDGTKRNAELQSTVRTQSREAVTQAQARIRGAVTRNKREKLTALLHHVSHRLCRRTGLVATITRTAPSVWTKAGSITA